MVLKILIVDDFSTMRRIVRSLLMKIGFKEFEMAEDGLKAINILKKDQDFGLIVTDWNMPDMDGIELLKYVRATPNLKHIPVLMVTAEAKKDQIIQAAHAGVNGYITKPFTHKTLESKIKKIFNRNS
ncbi:response regulator [Psychromonas sp. SP041]|uniref:response regulator n=1 Tax=Psychromonas sp. SP041 TaxID=1365007 RepID=UPI0010C7D443|nr:response regulator [Psychromonas sp. SP041]